MEALPSQLEPFADRLAEIFGPQEGRRILGSMSEPKRVGVFRNPLRTTPQQDGDALAGLQPLAGLPDMCWAPPQARQALVTGEPVMSGQLYLMNPSSYLAALLLGPEPEQEVLDLAAAPGGKTLVMAALMGNRGRLAAVESVRPRFHRMRANLARCGVTLVQSYLDDGRRTGRKVPERFDRVLLDAPCSSEARIRLDEPASYRHWSLKKIRETSRKQRGLIRSAFAALKPGGRLLYCTCAFAPEENEVVVQHLLGAETGARVLPLEEAMATCRPDRLDASRGWAPGLVCWQGRALDGAIRGAVRLLPDDLWDGFFLCLIGKEPR
ncbi:MAG: RsmB/NOP family class I SAM-dependent RNA methyltransferase [Anaerolineae bacterium]